MQEDKPSPPAQDGKSDPEALFATLYAELHRLAQRQLARNNAPVSMTPTTLLHGAYIDLAQGNNPEFPDNARFIGYVARVMRGLIVDRVRNRIAQKRGGAIEKTEFTPQTEALQTNDRELLLISDALDELTKVDPDLAEVVNLKFFCGFSFAEIAAMRDQSERTVQRAWEKARIYLHQSIRPDLLP
jgi:RNA polymerase sigma factor (TIGR02999 family)